MKTFLRAMASIMLVTVLVFFTMWRHNAFPDLSGITNFVVDAAGRLNNINDKEGITAGGRPADEKADFPDYVLSGEINPELEKRIYTAMMTQEKVVDIAEFHLDEGSLQSVVSRIRFLHPDLFFVDKTFGFTKDDFTDAVLTLKPRYLYNEEQTAQKMAEYQSFVQTIAAGAPADGNDFDKLLYLHDYFVREYEYDYDYEIRDAYHFFIEKKGVCQAYMLALIATADALGIEARPVTSSRMNHAWNMVKLDGVWYHIDITWDDTVSYPSYTSYDYFLQSDAGIVDIDRDRIDETVAEPDWHCDWEATQKATDVRYDKAVWRETNTPMIKGGNMYYCAVYTGVDESRNRSGAVYAGESPAVMGELFPIQSIWHLDGGSQYYMGCYAGLVMYGDLLIYNTHNSLRAYHTVEKRDYLLSIFANIGTDCIFGLTEVSQTGKVTCVVSSVAMGGLYYLMDYTIVA